MKAGYNALVSAVKTLRPKNNSYQVTETIEKVVKSFGVSPLRGVLSHEVQRGVVDGQLVISNVSDAEDRVQAFDVEANHVFALDIVVSKTKESSKNKYTEIKTTVFKRNPDINTELKIKSSRTLLNEIHQTFGDFAFSINSLKDPN